jgi:hypothetical protein
VHCELAQLADGADGGSEVLAELDGAIPLFWVTLASPDDVVAGDGAITMAMAPADAVERSGGRLDALVASHPGVYDGLVGQWRELLAGLDGRELSVSITGARRNLGRDLAEPLASFPDPSTPAFTALAKVCGWRDGLPRDPVAGDDPAVAERLCGRPRFRPVPWPVPAADLRPADLDRAAGRRKRVGRTRLTTGRDSRFPVPGAAAAVDPPDPTGSPRRSAPPSRFSGGWLVTGPALVGVLCLTSWEEWSKAERTSVVGILGLVVLAVLVLASCVRRWWPLPALVVMCVATLTYAIALNLNIGPLGAVIAFAIVTVVGRAPWPQAGAGAVVAGATMAALFWHYGPGGHLAESILGTVVYVAAFAALGGALRRGRYLRVRNRARDRDTLTVVPVAGWRDG